MRTKLLLILALGITIIVNAQIPGGRRAMNAAASQSTTGTITMGKLIAQLVENINPAAFKSGFLQNERGFIQSANSTVQVTVLASLVKSLQAGLKPTAFGSGWASVSGQWISDANNIQTLQDAINLVNTLSDNLDPSSYAPQWEQNKYSFKSSLGSVTQ